MTTFFIKDQILIVQSLHVMQQKYKPLFLMSHIESHWFREIESYHSFVYRSSVPNIGYMNFLLSKAHISFPFSCNVYPHGGKREITIICASVLLSDIITEFLVLQRHLFYQINPIVVVLSSHNFNFRECDPFSEIHWQFPFLGTKSFITGSNEIFSEKEVFWYL